MHSREINIMAVMQKREELEAAARKEMESLQNRYKDLLCEYRPAVEKINQLNAAFSEEWDEKMKDFRKEEKSIVRKYKKALKELI